MEQSMKSLSDSHEEFRKNQQTMQDRMTQIYEMLAKQSNGENSRGRTELEKSRSAFLAMVAESTKQMEEHKRKIESFSPPCPSPAIQSLPKTLTPVATTITIKKKKGGDETTKIHPRQRRRRSSTTLAMLDRNLHHRSSALSNSRCQIVAITVAVPSNNHHLIPAIPAADPNIIGASNANNTVSVHLTTISSARAANR
jgi:chromosome segregation ATPase